MDNVFRTNRIFENGDQGILIGSGAQRNVSPPTLSSARSNDANEYVQGTVNCPDGSTCVIEVFDNCLDFSGCPDSTTGEDSQDEARTSLGAALIPGNESTTTFQLIPSTPRIGDCHPLTATNTVINNSTGVANTSRISNQVIATPSYSGGCD
jgi:hypothetical protein